MTWQTYLSILFCIKVLYFINEAAGFEKFCISEIDFQAINNGASNSLTGNTSLVPPESSPCFNGGLCISYEDENETTTFECRCPGAFTGEFCQLRNPCSPDPCQNGGTCEIFGDSGVCHCPVNFRGLFCNESNPDFSTSTPPSATSSYTQTETESTSTKSSSEMPVVTVKLKPQYPPMLFSYDEIDEYDINIRRTKDASNAVTSNSRIFTGTHLITSESNRSPKISSQENPCNYLVTQGTTTCLNAGKCHAIDNISFECECSAKYTGKLCEFLNACVSSPCQNEGTCFAFEDSGICSCPLGYKGTFCEEKLEPKTLSSHSKPVLQNSKRHEESYEDYDEDEIVVTQ
jgi:Notch-like protein